MTEEENEKNSGEKDASGKFQIRTEIPSESSGRTLDAITDLIRPISEPFGWFGDKIALSRQKTLLEIAKKTQERLNLTDKEVRPIPRKFLLPLIEKASLEDISDTKLIDMWANLIATAATDDVEMLGQYVTILSETTSSQARLMEAILRLNNEKNQHAGIFIDNYYYLNETGVPGSLQKHADIDNIDDFADALADELDIAGVAVDAINIYYKGEDQWPDIPITSPDSIYSDSKFYDFENLCRAGLLKKIEVKLFEVGIFDIDAHYYIVTPVGVDLYACCNPSKLTREARQIE